LKKTLRIILASSAVLFSIKALAHKPGLYTIDNNDKLNVVFAVIQTCPKAEGSLPGKLRTFTFALVLLFRSIIKHNNSKYLCITTDAVCHKCNFFLPKVQQSMMCWYQVGTTWSNGQCSNSS